ncbi:ATP-dependent DNA helicase RecG [Patescibacteria group bacterium]|nr:ATP-dependent DNA helicase RecG [Patescibacteria group bacterium]MBU1663292.1 ATP-dependent DNA helicase RecG [Patescibacteria group bacterium]MBU1934006.1 ATP-dependent DNA helicase RecG [Patescibacteria group bacterium]MBU2008140.1 ATP-dependent DNA helicase RecG [Patescibacteria group bacterium]MBU2233671.1 ATP-dependent DNA helicase RecG [Patescibacteria group bacterium]
MLTLDTDIIKISRIGESAAKRLKKLGIETARDLLFYFPFRYDDFSHLTPINKLQAGISANVVGQIELIQNKRSPRQRMNITEALINDGTEILKIIWFNQPFIARNLKVGDNISLAGKVEENYSGLTMNSPVYEKIQPSYSLCHVSGAVHTQGLVPNYHLTAKITQKQIRFLIKQIIGLSAQIIDWQPQEIKKNFKLISLADAIKKIHFPKNNFDLKQARERLAFDELFLIQLQSQLVKKNLSMSKSPAIKFYEQETKNFVNSLCFRLTNAQRKSAWEILQDIANSRPMSRLLEGDVGSGKTIVAIIVMLNAALNKKQAVLMVPTEILAKQHYDTICRLLSNFDIKIGLISRSQRQIFNFQFLIDKNKIKNQDIINNSDIIIGTHALIQEDIKFQDLALAIIDEQHRFGVEQRAALMRTNADKKHGLMPHLLSMTATPIPRSLALALYGDLDLSVINEMPKQRKKIITKIVPECEREKAYDFIREQIKQGRQVFVICPLIDISDKLGVKSVEEEYKKLDKIVFPDLTIGKLHGRLATAEKEKIMQEFLDNKIKILVSTSVVEVGVDIPNASVMMIEGADRFGLAQIHQFRGRVGRSIYQSYCFLFARLDLPSGIVSGSIQQSEITLKRLQALVDNHNGFDLAKMDLKFRGPGQVYGAEQKGFPQLKIASLFDYILMKQARDQAVKLIDIDPSLNKWPNLKEKLGDWEKTTHLE